LDSVGHVRKMRRRTNKVNDTSQLLIDGLDLIGHVSTTNLWHMIILPPPLPPLDSVLQVILSC